MSEGKYTATYKFILEGVGLTAPLDAAVRTGKHVRLFVGDANACEFKVEIVLENVIQTVGETAARTIANALYEQLIRNLSAHVERAVPPMLDEFTFEPNIPSAVARGIAVGASAVIAVGQASLAPQLFVPSIDAALDGVTPAAPAVEAALRMYRVAVETQDAPTSYLICYSALTLGAAHKHGSGKQKNVDKLLMAQDASLTATLGRDGDETLYTDLRNRFIHAEGRGQDPAGATADMKTHVRKFRELAARALLAL